MKSDLIEHSLNLVADRRGDPTALVYERLFERHPDMKPLFVRDTHDLVKGEMMAQAIECLLDFINERSYSDAFMMSEVINHENLGVPAAKFATFFEVMMETYRDILGADWTPAVEAAWRELLAEIDDIVPRQTAAGGKAA